MDVQQTPEIVSSLAINILLTIAEVVFRPSVFLDFKSH